MINSFNNIKNKCSDFGNTARDNILQFQVDNEVGSLLTVTVANSVATIKLISKSGKVLSTSKFNVDAGVGLSNVVLSDRKLIFTFSDESVMECDLSDIYNILDDVNEDIESLKDGKQDSLTQGVGISLNNNVISVDMTNATKGKVLTASSPTSVTWGDVDNHITAEDYPID